MNEKAANAHRKVGWLLLLKFESAIISDLQLFQVQQLSLSSEKDHLIQMCQTYSKARSAKLSSPEHWIQKLNVSEKHFFFTVFLCEWIMSYKLNFIQYRHFYHPLIDNSKTLLIDQPFHTKVRWMSCKWSCDHLLFYLFTRGCVYMYGQKIFRKISHEGRRPKCCPESKSFLQKDTIQWGKQSNWGVGKQHKTSPQISPEATHKNKREEPWKAGKKTAGIQTRLMTAVADKTQATLTRVIWTITQGKWTKTANKTHRNAQRPAITK